MSARQDVYSTYRFHIEIKGLTEASFTECSGLQAEIELFDWEEGGLNEYVHRLPGRVKAFPNIVLKRGIASDSLWTWYLASAQGRISRSNISIILYGYADMEAIRWNLVGALPVKWVGPNLKTDANEVTFESIELVHHGLTRA